jgi:hypothetical protein
MNNPDIIAVLELFPESEPDILYDIYVQVGKNKELLIETMFNGGQLPDEVQNNMAAADI